LCLREKCTGGASRSKAEKELFHGVSDSCLGDSLF
jgi:hypothetical protein